MIYDFSCIRVSSFLLLPDHFPGQWPKTREKLNKKCWNKYKLLKNWEQAELFQRKSFSLQVNMTTKTFSIAFDFCVLKASSWKSLVLRCRSELDIINNSKYLLINRYCLRIRFSSLFFSLLNIFREKGK